ncbi:membrane progestin receptor gamma-A [Clupea harengus]|uniref:Membrane progestin receptor gamma-A n=1 Tax=Clupea harengus TaxID=7950 RepID=A0A8M1KJ49_CLUHA|nr:membrane progestin receptor gamma-A [Clupea harengus]
MLNLIKLPHVLTINQVPKVFHEDGIISGYRPPYSSAKDCALSVFQPTNETLNIWTHFLPAWFFLWKLLMVALAMEEGERSLYSWPLLVYLASCCVYPLASSCAHTFSSMSVRARHVCFFFDYGAISLYSLGSAVVYSSYTFPQKWVNSTFHHWYVSIAVLNSFVCTALACCSRLGLPFLHYSADTIKGLPDYQVAKLTKPLRILAFALPYVYDNIPLFYRLFVCVGEGCTDNEANGVHHQHIALAFLTGFLFATRLPERLAPGSFDYIGNSHQLFHVFAITATVVQIKAIELDMVLRQTWLLAHSPPITFTNTVGVTLVSVAANLCVICIFSHALFSTTKNRDKDNKLSDIIKGYDSCSTRSAFCCHR